MVCGLGEGRRGYRSCIVGKPHGFTPTLEILLRNLVTGRGASAANPERAWRQKATAGFGRPRGPVPSLERACGFPPQRRTCWRGQLAGEVVVVERLASVGRSSYSGGGWRTGQSMKR